ncbi:GAP family protein [Mycobacterium sp. ACS4331]|uniref:GAP family protein n=1 Tax=Mycobacterium sp. ACS4331 TaxID=1834121 RepID=UPI00080248A4|nr:GAP family protein [Mycobacterium sp. ACS4331]OBF13597.1 hypothetical protein A5727_16085 [Mycobacterium sp. ACS4331]
MWGTATGLAALSALNPVRLALMLLIISRPRPVQNLLAYWLGCVTVGLFYLLTPVLVLNFVPNGFLRVDVDISPRFQIGFGAVILAITAGLGLRHLMRSRAKMAVAAGNISSTRPEKPHQGIPFLHRLDHRDETPGTSPATARQRLWTRLRDAWQRGALWVAYVLGMFSISVEGILFIAAVIVMSGFGPAAQISAVLVCIVIMFAPNELILVSYWIAPGRTQTVLGRVHDWTAARRTPIFLSICALAATWMLLQGISRL